MHFVLAAPAYAGLMNLPVIFDAVRHRNLLLDMKGTKHTFYKATTEPCRTEHVRYSFPQCRCLKKHAACVSMAP